MLLHKNTPASTFPARAPWHWALLPLVLSAGLAGCGDSKPAAGAPGAGAPGGGMPPPPQVGVVTVSMGSVPIQTELPGRVEAQRVAQVRARVNGVVLKRLFKEGSDVKAGQALFQIDPAPYEAAADSARAALARAEANLTQASTLAQRYKPLAEAKAISQQEYVNAQSALKQAEADVAGSKAALRTARLNLGYASVTAPISGRVGRALVTEGALVSAAEATPMALVQQVGTVYVNFTQSSGELLRLRKAIANGRLRSTGESAAQVQVVLEDGSVLPQPGKLLFSDLTVDASSGQVTLRAEVANADGLLLPGQYVRVRLSQVEQPQAMLLPQQAVTRSGQGDTVLVVGEGNKPGPRPIKIGGAQGSNWVVVDGLKPGEKVIVDGFQKMFVPGAPVTPVPWTPGASAPPAGGPAGPAAAGGASAAGNVASGVVSGGAASAAASAAR